MMLISILVDMTYFEEKQLNIYLFQFIYKDTYNGTFIMIFLSYKQRYTYINGLKEGWGVYFSFVKIDQAVI